jgi:hypothetical protein
MTMTPEQVKAKRARVRAQQRKRIGPVKAREPVRGVVVTHKAYKATIADQTQPVRFNEIVTINTGVITGREWLDAEAMRRRGIVFPLPCGTAGVVRRRA